MVRLQMTKGVVFRIYGARRHGKRAFWSVIGSKRERVGTICGEKYPDKRGNGPSQSSGTASPAQGPTPSARVPTFPQEGATPHWLENPVNEG
jgi:hypothetical protein